MEITFRRIDLEKRYPLVISRGVSGNTTNLFVAVSRGGKTGIGELAAMTSPGGETADTGERELRAFAAELPSDSPVAAVDKQAREFGLRPRAHAALDMALWDLLAKEAGMPLYRMLGLGVPVAPTSVTVGINPPAIVAEQTAEMLARTRARHLKIKLGSPDGSEADEAILRAAATAARPYGPSLRVDANGGWDVPTALRMMPILARAGVDYLEQPLPKGREDDLAAVFRARCLPIFADESCDVATDVPGLADRTDGINVKLMKTGGITEALRVVAVARAHGLQTMIGCMGESSVAISAGASLGALFDFIDLDSQLNLLNDPAAGASLTDGIVMPPDRPGHGAVWKCHADT